MNRALILAGLLGAGLAADAGAEAAGFLYGTVETTSGNRYEGRLRWGTEEAFWDDHFNASKEGRPATGELPRGYRGRQRRIEVFGLEIAGPWDRAWAARQLIVRFGDLAEVAPRGNGAEILLRSGQRLEVRGGSNDIGARITVWDGSVGKSELEWKRIRSIRFAAAPADLDPGEHRLKARVRTRAGEFAGYLQWDLEEALASDVLDAESDDGDVEIEMGRIRSIVRASRRSSTVVLADGRSLELSGTNDVDASNRGIVVEDERFGRIELSWDEFERADLELAPRSGRGYEEYPKLGPIVARVVARDGRVREGRIAFDLDETERWEMLDGGQDGIRYSIPFADLGEIRRDGADHCRVTLRNGRKLRLGGSTDVGEFNAGIAFLDRKGDDAYLPWDEVESIELR